MKHSKISEVHTLIKHGIAVLVTGEKGSGKTTLIQQVAESLGLQFVCMSMTRQTTLSHLIGFKNVNGIYDESPLRKVCENGGLFLLDEIDAADPNVLLTLNTFENGFISFPDKMVECHPDFRLAATSNPQDEHYIYTGRSKLDASTLDRFDVVHVDRDCKLEESIVGKLIVREMDLLRKIMSDNGCSNTISMRDSIRYQKRRKLKLDKEFIERIVGDNPLIIEKFKKAAKDIPKYSYQYECSNIDDLYNVIINECKEEEKSDVKT